MEIYCLDDFKREFERLLAKKSYKTLGKEIIEYFFNKPIDQLRSGVNLNNNLDVPYIKKRLGGRGGFRVYFLLVIKRNSIYLMFVHPKTGALGSSNIDNKSKTFLYKKVHQCINSGDLYRLTLNKSGTEIQFESL